MEQRDIIRWFKKGWVYTIATVIIGVLANIFLKLLSIQAIIDRVIANPADFGALLAIGILSLLWGLVLFPIIGGFLIEEIDKRIRR